MSSSSSMPPFSLHPALAGGLAATGGCGASVVTMRPSLTSGLTVSGGGSPGTVPTPSSLCMLA